MATTSTGGRLRPVVSTLFGHRDVRLLDGGRQKWVEEAGPSPPTCRPASPPTTRWWSATTRPSASSATRSSSTSATAGGWSIACCPASTGRAAGHARLPAGRGRCAAATSRARLRALKRAANDDGTFKSADEAPAIREGELGLGAKDDIVAYCRIGERSSHTWFVLSQLLGFRQVRNYDGSWVEWGNSVRVPIERSSEPGPDPRLKAVG